MKKTKIIQPAVLLVGLKVETNLKEVIAFEAGKQKAKLAQAAELKNVLKLVGGRVHPGVTYTAYTDYRHRGTYWDYTYFIGEAVESLGRKDQADLNTLIIPAGCYQKFTTEPGKHSEVLIDAWIKIWSMDEQDLGGKRKYLTDFAVYDERATDPNHTVIDIYIGIY
jgi:predicted transcriptional regulator YdeE